MIWRAIWRYVREMENYCINLERCSAKWYTLRRVRVFRKQNASHLLTAMLNFWYLYPTLVTKGATPQYNPIRFQDTPSRQILGFTSAICVCVCGMGLAERCMRIHTEETKGGKRNRVKCDVPKTGLKCIWGVYNKNCWKISSYGILRGSLRLGVLYVGWLRMTTTQPRIIISKTNPFQAWTGPEGSRRLRLPDLKTISTWTWYSCQPYVATAFTPLEIFLVLICVRGWGDTRATVRP